MPVELGQARVLDDRGKALLVRVAEVDDKPIWIPKSGIHDDSEVWKADQEGELVVKDWLAEKRGWA